MKHLIRIMSVFVIAAMLFAFASCGNTSVKKTDYTAYTLEQYQKEDYSSKEIAYQFTQESEGRYSDSIINLYKDSALCGVQSYNPALVADRGYETEVYYYGYWNELENGDLDIHIRLGWEDPDEILEIEMEQYTASKTSTGYTLPWKSHSLSVKSYLMDCNMVCDNSIKYQSISDLIAKVAAEVIDTTPQGGGESDPGPSGNEIFSSDSCINTDGMTMVFYDSGEFRVNLGDRSVGRGTWTTENGLTIADGSGNDYPCSVALNGSEYTVTYGDNSFIVSKNNVPSEGGEEQSDIAFSADECTTFAGLEMNFLTDGTFEIIYSGSRIIGNGTWTTENGLTIADGSENGYECSVTLEDGVYVVNYGDNSFRISADKVSSDAASSEPEVVFEADECTTFAGLEMKYYSDGTFEIIYSGSRIIGNGTWTTENGLTIADGSGNDYPCSVTLEDGVYMVNYGDNSFTVKEENVK